MRVPPTRSSSRVIEEKDEASKAVETVALKEEYPTLLSDQTIQQLGLQILDLTQSENQMERLKKYLGVPTFDAEFDSRSNSHFVPGNEEQTWFNKIEVLI